MIPATGPMRDPLRIVLALWLALGVTVSVRIVLCPESHTVYPIFAASAVHWWHDQPLSVRSEHLDYFRYPPLFPVLMTPLFPLGLTAGGIAWAWLSLAVYLAG